MQTKKLCQLRQSIGCALLKKEKQLQDCWLLVVTRFQSKKNLPFAIIFMDLLFAPMLLSLILPSHPEC